MIDKKINLSDNRRMIYTDAEIEASAKLVPTLELPIEKERIEKRIEQLRKYPHVDEFDLMIRSLQAIKKEIIEREGVIDDR